MPSYVRPGIRKCAKNRALSSAIRFPVATSIMLSSVYARMRQLTHEMMSRLSNAVNDMTVLS